MKYFHTSTWKYNHWTFYLKFYYTTCYLAVTKIMLRNEYIQRSFSIPYFLFSVNLKVNLYFFVQIVVDFCQVLAFAKFLDKTLVTTFRKSVNCFKISNLKFKIITRKLYMHILALHILHTFSMAIIKFKYL